MEHDKKVSRRSFLKSAGIGTAGLTMTSSSINPVFSAQQGRLAWSEGMKINPAIDNNKVVCCYDMKMFTSEQQANAANTFQKQNTTVDTTRVENNMDGLVISLTGKSKPQEAWATIFRKSPAKEWSQIKVAIKVNCIYEGIMPRIAIVGKVCKELIDLGVSAANITIYDACHNASGNGKYTPYVGNGLPANVKVSNQAKYGGTVSSTKIDVGSSQLDCVNLVLESDILVNCAVNKGHSQTDKGGFTLTMKNHTGTMKLSCPSGAQEMVNENKSDAILGGDPPRQQLCIVDSLWAAKPGPLSAATHLPGRIIMGTFGPAVDIAVTRNIREKIMSATHNNNAIQTIMSSFGFTENDLQWVEVPPYDPTSVRQFSGKNDGLDFSVITNRGALNSFETRFTIPSNTVSHIEITDLSGKVIRKLTNTSGSNKVVWNGCSESGAYINAGAYMIRIVGNGFSKTQMLKML